ncbi:hypothetical protein MPTK1_3g15710 [Marchantia polymorpha subsp. ruderalis]|uniref:Uncharacterized protein n=2 Tax=Marchantia polymorpha TaxID=3197 RepID=A0AAF6B168_MARPO|nr:hypothetical protein MARPO_0004s0101 [Marchantia polymorpha]BBN05752.1 hypothetical protein Mp_3g15710 [Marchantia polymorpha subsp. ruderalis]|eukprot:PTQ48828.1 hypothetical protein MARPO_0004s0101 [Marchantia polymorpha]
MLCCPWANVFLSYMFVRRKVSPRITGIEPTLKSVPCYYTRTDARSRVQRWLTIRVNDCSSCNRFLPFAYVEVRGVLSRTQGTALRPLSHRQKGNRTAQAYSPRSRPQRHESSSAPPSSVLF